MKFYKLYVLSILLSAAPSTLSASRTPLADDKLKSNLLNQFSKISHTKDDVTSLQKYVISLKGKSVPALIEVMKNGKYPEKNRWVATFLLGRVMGVKSAPFIKKFTKHPNWIMRMASLKTLLSLGQKKYASTYSSLLKDKSFIVRNQALENIKHLNLRSQASFVWQMLYDKKNYYTPTRKGKSLTKKRTNLIKKAIKTVGDLRFLKAEKTLLSMIQKKKYKDIFNELDYSLIKISGKKSPNDNKMKKRFWQKYALTKTTI